MARCASAVAAYYAYAGRDMTCDELAAWCARVGVQSERAVRFDVLRSGCDLASAHWTVAIDNAAGSALITDHAAAKTYGKRLRLGDVSLYGLLTEDAPPRPRLRPRKD